jgi:hypothetical protein
MAHNVEEADMADMPDMAEEVEEADMPDMAEEVEEVENVISIPQVMKDNTKNATIEYLINPLYHHILKKTKQNENIDEKNKNKEAIKFYRKRITALIKDMLKDPNIKPTSGIKEMHDEYVNCLITYFKMLDRTDILQNQYANAVGANAVEAHGVGANAVGANGVGAHGVGAHAVGANAVEANGVGANAVEANAVGANAVGANAGISKANTSMMRKIITMPTLDNFVVNTSVKTKAENIPTKKEINLKCPTLKTKGIIKKVKK